jgi:hypothetical protein
MPRKSAAVEIKQAVDIGALDVDFHAVRDAIGTDEIDDCYCLDLNRNYVAAQLCAALGIARQDCSPAVVGRINEKRDRWSTRIGLVDQGQLPGLEFRDEPLTEISAKIRVGLDRDDLATPLKVFRGVVSVVRPDVKNQFVCIYSAPSTLKITSVNSFINPNTIAGVTSQARDRRSWRDLRRPVMPRYFFGRSLYPLLEQMGVK